MKNLLLIHNILHGSINIPPPEQELGTEINKLESGTQIIPVQYIITRIHLSQLSAFQIFTGRALSRGKIDEID
jgi:hypothetical protein